MAIYKIFPEQSATLYSYYPTLNTGLDEILELSTFESYESTNEVSRILIKFPTDEIGDIITNKIGTASFDAYLKTSLANASELPLNYTIYSYPLATNWNVGTGRLANSPITTDGASWIYKDQLSGSTWFTAGIFPTGTTGSYQTGSNVGGGLWYTGSSYVATQSFTNKTTKNIELKITNTVKAWNSSSIENYGTIIKHENSIEFTSAPKFETKYFSDNTHTIYPPCLELRWNDFYYSSSLTQASSIDIIATLANNINEYQQDAVQRFRVNVRDKYPARAFTTSSVYLNNKILPTSSYWSIKDLDTEEIVVDFDTSYTKISADNNGNYFDVYMNGLEPERYYQLILKTIISGSTLVLNDNYYFKVIR
jgi:hypothetical protein